MARYGKDVEFRSSRVRELHDTGTVGSVGSLRLRVRGTKIDAYVPIRSSYTSPPKFSGVLSTDGTGITVTGRIKESFNGPAWPRGDIFVIVIMLALVVLGVVGLTTSYSHGGLPPLLIGVIGTPAFTVLYRVHARQRLAEWRLRMGDLERELESYVTGDRA